MSDPESQEAPPPAQPPRPAAIPRAPSTTSQSQLESDERYARQLAEHYSGASSYGGESRGRPPVVPRQKRETNLKPNELYEDNHSFFDGNHVQNSPTELH